jgi:hypothetical protein
VVASIDRLSIFYVRPLRVAKIDVNSTAADLLLGDAATLTATPKSATGRVLARTVTWTSRSPSVASVDPSGQLRALFSGSTWVIAECEGVRDSVRVAVGVKAQRIDLASPGAVLTGDTLQVIASALDAVGAVIAQANITWTSSDPTTATVSSTGRLIAVRRGTITLTAAAPGATASVEVPISDAVTIESMTNVDGQPSQLNAVTGLTLVRIQVAAAAAPARAIALVITCGASAPLSIDGTPGSSTLSVVRLPTDSVDIAGRAITPNGACTMAAKATTSRGSVRTSDRSLFTLTNLSSFVVSYDVTGSNAPLGTAFPASVPAADGTIWKTGAVTLKLQARSFDTAGVVTRVKGSFLGKDFDATSATGVFSLAFPNVAGDASGRSVADFVSPAGGSLPVISSASFANGSAAFTSFAAPPPLWLDNQAPKAATRFALPAATAAIGWVNGTYNFGASSYTSAADGAGVGGTTVVEIDAGLASGVTPLAGGSATGAACVRTGLQRITLSGDVLALLPAGAAVTATTFTARAFEMDRLGNVRCTDIPGTTFGVDAVPPTITRAPTNTQHHTVQPYLASIHLGVITTDAGSGLADASTVMRRTVENDDRSGYCAVGGPGCTMSSSPTDLTIQCNTPAGYLQDSVIVADRVGNTATLSTVLICGQPVSTFQWDGFPAVWTGGATVRLSIHPFTQIGSASAQLDVDYSYSRAAMTIEVDRATDPNDPWDPRFNEVLINQLVIRDFMRQLQIVDASDAPYDDTGEYSRAYAIIGGVTDVAGFGNSQFYGLGDKSMPLGYTYFGKGIQSWRVTTAAASVSNGGASTATVALSAVMVGSSQPFTRKMCFYYKSTGPWLEAACTTPIVTQNGSTQTLTYQASWNPPASLGTTGSIAIRAIGLNSTGDGLSTNTSSSVRLAP